MVTKRRIGFRSTPELESILQRALTLPQRDDPPTTTTTAADATPPHRTIVGAALEPLSLPSARATVQQYLDDTPTPTATRTITTDIIHATNSLLHHHNLSTPPLTNLEPELRTALLAAGPLLFPTPPSKPPDADAAAAYQRRLERLRLAEQERKYTKLTSNLDKTEDMDATVKGMMYATSVGLNMIVAPISFGVFMYFFSGALFGYWDAEEVDSGRGGDKLDIRKVIIGVVSGVAMLFIEMILFVIRNHEMDRFMTKKMKTQKKNPFGYVKSREKRTFNG